MTSETTHAIRVCCGCGSESELLQRVEGHRFCPECSSDLSKEVWARYARGIEVRPGSDGAAHSALLDILDEGHWVCDELPEVDQCLVPPMRLLLVAGFHQLDRRSEWILITVDGELTVDPLCAQLFTFSAAGVAGAFAAVRRWTDVLGRDCHLVPFVSRVLVTGDPEDPDAVVEAFRFEGDEPPVTRRYPFDKA